MERITPAELYRQFKIQQPYITDRQYDSVLNNVLESIIASQRFEIDDYHDLYKWIRREYDYHWDSEWHYRIAIKHNNNLAWKSIEKFINRKPYLFDNKRCYEGFEFSTTDGDTYKCTGFDGSRIKFKVWFKKPEFKLLKFTHAEFKDYFNARKMVKY